MFWYGEEVGPTSTGALIVVAFYFIVGCVIYWMRHILFINPMIKRLAKIIMEDEDEN